MIEHHDHNLKITVNVPVSKDVFEAWEQLDGYQEYLMEDFDAFIYEALSKSVSRKQMNNYIRIGIKHARDTLEEMDHNNTEFEWIESRDGMEA